MAVAALMELDVCEFQYQSEYEYENKVRICKFILIRAFG